MGAYRTIHLYDDRDKTVSEFRLRKPPAPRNLDTWLRYATDAASFQRAAFFIFGHHGQWHVYRTALKSNMLLRSFPSDAAAIMWLHHRGHTL